MAFDMIKYDKEQIDKLGDFIAQHYCNDRSAGGPGDAAIQIIQRLEDIILGSTHL